MAHGCEAGRFEQALDIFTHRILRWNEQFSLKKLCAFSADLAALTNFFDPRTQQPLANLSERAKAFVLNHAGFCLYSLGRATEASKLLEVAFEIDISLNENREAARTGGNLSEIYLTIGALQKVQVLARKVIDQADLANDPHTRITSRASLATALHYEGRVEEAELLFMQAEKMQERFQSEFPILYALQGLNYCDLLLDQGKYTEVVTRTEQMLKWASQAKGVSVWGVNLTYVFLGRAYVLRSQHESAENLAPLDLLNHAVRTMRQAGLRQYLPLALLAKEEGHRNNNELDEAHTSLDEAMSIALSSGMSLYQSDCHLEYARLHLARGEREKARESWEKAKGMIERMGYHRRDRDVQEIEEQFKAAGG
jgi:tetratricopeptide (TPR) repeat protein